MVPNSEIVICVEKKNYLLLKHLTNKKKKTNLSNGEKIYTYVKYTEHIKQNNTDMKLQVYIHCQKN